MNRLKSGSLRRSGTTSDRHSNNVQCVCNYSVNFLLEILNLYWDSLLFRGESNFLYGLTGNTMYTSSRRAHH